MNRKTALKSLAGLASTALIPGSASAAMQTQSALKNNIHHSVCQWCYDDIPLEKLCEAAKDIGITSIDLLRADQWAIAARYGLT